MPPRSASARHPAARAAGLLLVVAAGVGCSVGKAPLGQPNTGAPQTAAEQPAQPDAVSPDDAASPENGVPSVPASALPAPITGRPGTPRGAVPATAQVNRMDAAALSRAVAVTMWTIDTRIDATRWDAQMRAAPYLTPTFLASLRGGAPITAPGASWNDWAAHQGYTTVTATSADEMGKPPDTGERASHAWKLAVSVTGVNGWKAGPFEVITYVTLERAGPTEPWSVSGVTDSGGPEG